MSRLKKGRDNRYLWGMCQKSTLPQRITQSWPCLLIVPFCSFLLDYITNLSVSSLSCFVCLYKLYFFFSLSYLPFSLYLSSFYMELWELVFIICYFVFAWSQIPCDCLGLGCFVVVWFLVAFQTDRRVDCVITEERSFCALCPRAWHSLAFNKYLLDNYRN